VALVQDVVVGAGEDGAAPELVLAMTDEVGAKTMPAKTAPIDSSSSGTTMTQGLSCGFSGPWW
jgi:hypothetical protein